MLCALSVGFDHCHLMQVGQTPLHCAAGGGHLAVATLLLDRGATIEAQDEVSSYWAIDIFQGLLIVALS